MRGKGAPISGKASFVKLGAAHSRHFGHGCRQSHVSAKRGSVRDHAGVAARPARVAGSGDHGDAFGIGCLHRKAEGAGARTVSPNFARPEAHGDDLSAGVVDRIGEGIPDIAIGIQDERGLGRHGAHQFQLHRGFGRQDRVPGSRS